ncbi:DNA-binding domain-containing protein, partial [Paenibacillus xylanexedens]|uniref:DNA-binding domain-containing protein n=1 Tax=Paenibacillus xylanexedens TaxID=528191 RepID=UPI0034D971AB
MFTLINTTFNTFHITNQLKPSHQPLPPPIFQTLTHLLSLPLTHYTHPNFHNYPSKFFHFTHIPKKILHLQNNL